MSEANERNQPKGERALSSRAREMADEYDGFGRSHPISDGLRECADALDQKATLSVAFEQMQAENHSFSAECLLSRQEIRELKEEIVRLNTLLDIRTQSWMNAAEALAERGDWLKGIRDENQRLREVLHRYAKASRHVLDFFVEQAEEQGEEGVPIVLLDLANVTHIVEALAATCSPETEQGDTMNSGEGKTDEV